MTSYKDLIVWQKSRILVRKIYLLTQKLPREETFGITNQIRRAVISIPSNIAEGYDRGSNKEFVRFLKIAKGSAAEVETQLILCIDLGYLTLDDIQEVLALHDEIIRMLGTLIIKTEQRLNLAKDCD